MNKRYANGRKHTVDADPCSPGVWAPHDTLGMTGTKFRCGAAVRRLHRAHGRPAIRSCVTPISAAEAKDHHHRSGHRRQ